MAMTVLFKKISVIFLNLKFYERERKKYVYLIKNMHKTNTGINAFYGTFTRKLKNQYYMHNFL